MTQTSAGRPSIGVILGQLVGALMGGLVVAALLYFGLGYALLGAGLGMGLLTIQVFGIVIGFGAGAGLGVGVAGRWLGQPGNTWLAAISGAVTGLLVVLILRLLNLGGLGGLLWVGLPLTIIDALVVYNLPLRRI